MLDLVEHFALRPGVISIVGMAKNTGKTVTFNALQRSLQNKGYSLGLTSIGRDGERQDVLTRLPKPPVQVSSGSVVATAKSLIMTRITEEKNGAAFCEKIRNVNRDETWKETWDYLEGTGVWTVLGEVGIFRCKKETQVLLAGPQKVSEINQIVRHLSSWGAQIILIDGAFDRQGLVNPLISDQVILASGATLGGTIEEVVAKTKARVEQFSLPHCADLEAIKNAKEMKSRICWIRNDSVEWSEHPSNTSLLSKEEWLEFLRRSQTEWTKNTSSLLWVRGAIGEGLGEALKVLNHPPTVLIENGGKIFLPHDLWRQLCLKEVRFRVLNPIHLSGITVNPVYPGRNGLDPERLLAEMRKELRQFSVVDIMQGKGRRNVEP